MCFNLFNLSYIDGYGSYYGVKQILCYVLVLCFGFHFGGCPSSFEFTCHASLFRIKK